MLASQGAGQQDAIECRSHWPAHLHCRRRLLHDRVGQRRNLLLHHHALPPVAVLIRQQLGAARLDGLLLGAPQLLQRLGTLAPAAAAAPGS